MELCIQLATIMIGNQAINSILEILIPFLTKLYNSFRVRTGMDRKSSDDDLICCNQWTEDYKLIGWNSRGLFHEYLEMVLQYGFVTIFVTAFPLAPFFALINNIFEMRLDAKKFIKYSGLFREAHKIIRTGMLTATDDPYEINHLWKDLAEKLNSNGNGPVKTVDAWKRVFVEWKCAVRRKAREIKASLMGTGGGEGVLLKLSEIEERFLEVSGRCVVDGIAGLPEAGITSKYQSSVNPTTETPVDEIVSEEYIVSADGTLEKSIAVTTNVQAEKKIYKRKETPKRSARNVKEKNRLVSVAETYSAATEATNLVLSNLAESITKYSESNLALAKAKEKKNKIEILKLKLKYGEHIETIDD